MKRKNILYRLLSIGTSFLAVYLYKNKFKEEIDSFFDSIPNIYFTIVLGLLLIYSIINLFLPKKQTNTHNTLFIATENDYQNTYKSHSFIGILVIFIFFYALLLKDFNLTTIIIILLLITWSINGTFLRKTSTFKIIENVLTFERENKKRRFPIKEIKEFKIAPNEIRVLYHDNEKLISFLEIKEEDYKEIKSWFQKNLPEIIVSKSKAS